MLHELTSHQSSLIPPFIKHWVNIGLSTTQISNNERLRITRDILTKLLGYKKKIPTIVLMESPKNCWKAAKEFSGGLSQKQIGLEAGVCVQQRISTIIEATEVWNLVKNFLSKSIQLEMHHVEREVRFYVDRVLDNIFGVSSHRPYIRGHWMSPRLSWYAFMPEILSIWKYPGLWSTFMEIQHLGFVYLLKDVCIVGNRPTRLYLNEDGNLHKDGGPAIAWADGVAYYYLNGIKMPKWLAETPAMEIDCRKFSKIRNVEVRREFIRKVGVERIVQKIGGKVLDKQGNYEVLLVDLGGTTGKWPYLKMLNPSIGVWHLECLSRECRTVREAINFRASRLRNFEGDWNPEVLT